MRLANLADRATLVLDDATGADVHTLSGGRFGPESAAIYDEWDAFVAWAAGVDAAGSADALVKLDETLLGPPSPQPRQLLGVGLNYRAHAEESGYDVPQELPPVFAKFVSSLTGPRSTVVLPAGGHTDWEVELVVVVGRTLTDVAPDEVWPAIAGVTLGQDLSERITQHRPPAPQFSLGKSFAGFSPTGPWLVTVDELADPDAVELGCAIDGETVQSGNTRDLIHSVPELVSKLSRVITLYPGDLVFTGTPEGVGFGRTPQRFLAPGEQLRSWADGIGELHQSFTGPGPR